MEDSKNQDIILIALIVFIAINGLIAIIGTIRTRRLSHKSSEDVLTAHFLGGRSFGPIVLFGTMFASLFSGGTVVGLPQESYYTGWITMRWIQYHPYFIFIFAGIAPRMRKASMVRNHQTPVDFITDMYQSQLLRYTVAITQMVAQFIWMCSNIVAIKNDFNSSLGKEPDYPWITVGIVAFILVSEWFGGMNAVALTDCVQGFIMVIGGLSVVSVIKKHWGGWIALDPETFSRPDFYQTPSEQQQWDWWQNGFLQWGAVFFPVQIQRVYSSETVKGVQMGAWACFMGPWVAQFGFIFMGIMGVAMLGESCTSSADPESCMSPESPFSAILEELMNLGGFPMAAAVILQCSALAAIMSTTDSLLISISQIVTTEVVYPLKPNATPNQVNWFGRGVSAAVSALALILGLTWKGSINLLFQLNEPFSMQLVPPFMIGLLSPKLCHPWSLAGGAIMGMVFTIIMEVIATDNTDFANYALRPGISTFFINCVSVILLEGGRIGYNRLKGTDTNSSIIVQDESGATNDGEEEHNSNEGEEEEQAKDPFVENPKKSTSNKDEVELDCYEDIAMKPCFPNRPAWDKPKLQRFGAHPLTPELLNIMMESTGHFELIKNWYFLGFMVFAVTLTTPLTPEFQPPLENGIWSVLPAVVRGCPWWAFKAIILLLVSFLVAVPMIMSMPSNLSAAEEKLLRSGINADIVDLDPEEKGDRTQYDQPNASVLSRRKLISQQTVRILEVNKRAEEVAMEIKVNDVGRLDAQNELNKLVSRRNLMGSMMASHKPPNKMLSDLAEGADEDIENTNKSADVDFEEEANLHEE